MPINAVATVLARGSSLKYPQYPCFVKLSFNHNHPLDSGHALSFRPVSVATKDAYMHLFENGNSASSARHEYVRYLQLEHDGKTDIQRLLADRSTNPGKGHGQRLRSNKWTIPVQATALSKRATKHCGGKPLKAGRPSLMQKKSKTENTGSSAVSLACCT